MTPPRLIFLAGPNGAGKSTFYESYLQVTGLDFVNADRLTAGLGITNQEAATVADQLRLNLLLAGESFITETVFSDPVGAKLQFLREAMAAGYQVTFYFVGLTDPGLSGARVWQRVQAGGHDVPPERLNRRYAQSLENLAVALTFVPEAHVFDNSSSAKPFRLVLSTASGVIAYRSNPLPTWLAPVVHDLRCQP